MDLSVEKLVAYIDGELDAREREAVAAALAGDAGARARLERLKSGGRPFADAFEPLLAAAPDERLQAMFAGLVARNAETGGDAPAQESGNVTPLRRTAPAGGTPLWRMAAAAAILAFVFAGGMYAGGLFRGPVEVAEEQPGWREAAARYAALFSAETLDSMAQDAAERRAYLARVEAALSLDLPDERLADPALDFRGAQLLQFQGRPLAQFAYLGGGKPVLLCIIPTQNDPDGPATENRQGLNLVHWVADGYGYMVIGDLPETELAQIAERFRAQFS